MNFFLSRKKNERSICFQVPNFMHIWNANLWYYKCKGWLRYEPNVWAICSWKKFVDRDLRGFRDFSELKLCHMVVIWSSGYDVWKYCYTQIKLKFWQKKRLVARIAVDQNVRRFVLNTVFSIYVRKIRCFWTGCFESPWVNVHVG